MGRREDLARRLRPLLASASFAALEELLPSQSNLPGPRGNLELAWAFGDCFANTAIDDAQWAVLLTWASISAEEAPTNDPREFLPFCALQALGSVYLSAGHERKPQIIAILRTAASDSRWRMREGVAMAFQRIAERDFGMVQEVFTAWMPDASLMERRAMVATLAHPPTLDDADHVLFCFQITDKILTGLHQSDERTRKSEEFRILRQGLEYAISVFVAALPDHGFLFLKRWGEAEDSDIKRIVRSNLSKGRLTKKYGLQVNEVLAVL